MIQPMTPDEWEQEVDEWELDILNRQRNIVFPDTMLNEGRFFRNMVSGQIPLNPVQKFGIVLITAPFIATGCIGTALAIGDLLTTQGVFGRGLFIVPIFTPIAQVGFGIIVMVRGLLAEPVAPEEETDESSLPTLPIDGSDEEPPPTPPTHEV
ncbi:MAG TPA: hypothetical protein VKH81_14430 [Candidatus Angelobacter sp.]|nr:hypothetical protein [Candidatus Angelobacter sp.]